MSIREIATKSLYPYGSKDDKTRAEFINYLFSLTEEILYVCPEVNVKRLYADWSSENYDKYLVQEAVDLVVGKCGPVLRGRNDLQAVLAYYRNNIPESLKANDYYSIRPLLKSIGNIKTVI